MFFTCQSLVTVTNTISFTMMSKAEDETPAHTQRRQVYKRKNKDNNMLPLIGEPCRGGVVPFTCTNPDATVDLVVFFIVFSDGLSRYAGTAACSAGVVAFTESLLELWTLVVE